MQDLSNAALACQLLGFPEQPPLSPADMARALQVTFAPPHTTSRRLDQFAADLKQVLSDLGVRVLPYAEALVPGTETVKPDVVIVEQGEGESDRLAIRRVSGLYQNPIVGLFEGPPPVTETANLQDTLDAIVGVLAWNMTHVPIFIEEDRWTICTMNGAVVRCGDHSRMKEDVSRSLVPKLSAQVVPPKRDEILFEEGALDTRTNGFAGYVRDFMEAAAIWRQNGLMLAHTSVDALAYRDRYLRRIVAAYLDHRTGMSYGFLARQLPVDVPPAVALDAAPACLRAALNGQLVFEHEGVRRARLRLKGTEWLAPVPDVWVLSTRSGCDKTNLDPERDLIGLGLRAGRVVVRTPEGLDAQNCRPSYDTLAILAHAIGNALAASVLRALDPAAPFSSTLAKKGLSISHWHGYPVDEIVPDGYVLHGRKNPPVSCSTPQSAVFAFAGKLEALERHPGTATPYRGDVHVEPHHGTNVSGCLSLTETADWVDAVHQAAHAE